MNNLEEVLLGLEERLVYPDVRASTELIDLLVDEFREFGSSGRVFTRDEIVDLLAAEASREITLHDFRCEAISSDVALVTYRSSSESGEVLRSSLWVCRDGRWRMLFHQGTKAASSPDSDAVS